MSRMYKKQCIEIYAIYYGIGYIAFDVYQTLNFSKM